jgi:hypothetical protein
VEGNFDDLNSEAFEALDFPSKMRHQNRFIGSNFWSKVSFIHFGYLSPAVKFDGPACITFDAFD